MPEDRMKEACARTRQTARMGGRAWARAAGWRRREKGGELAGHMSAGRIVPVVPGGVVARVRPGTIHRAAGQRIQAGTCGRTTGSKASLAISACSVRSDRFRWVSGGYA